MKLQERIELLVRLGTYMIYNDDPWVAAKRKAFHQNNWFIPQFIDLAAQNIAENFLQPAPLQTIAQEQGLPETNDQPEKVGLVMAGNIPLVGFHDMLCTFLAGHYSYIKPSSKDNVLIRHIVEKLKEWNARAEPYFVVADMLKGCDAYILTGSNNSSRYFHYYFGKYPNIIRKNRTSVAILTGTETAGELSKLADDVHLYFGLGCRNVTKLYVPQGYDFKPLLAAFKKYSFFEEHNKYKNNYDHNLAMHILNNRYYMSNGTILLVEDAAVFSPIAQLHYEFYTDAEKVQKNLKTNPSIQSISGKNNTPFGETQCPKINTFADGVNTINFLMNLAISKAK